MQGAIQREGERGDDEAAEKLRKMRMAEEDIDAALHRGGGEGEDGDGGGDGDGAFDIWPANERALEAFLRVRRQWRVSPAGGVMGFDYSGVEALLRMSGIEVDVALLDDLAVMEDAAVEVLTAKAGQ